MSALPPKADMDQHRCDVRFVPKADIEWFIGRKKMAPTPVCRGQVRRRVRDDRHDKGGKERPRCQTPPYSTIIGWRRQWCATQKCCEVSTARKRVTAITENRPKITDSAP